MEPTETGIGQLEEIVPGKRVALIGVGNRGRMDDGVGSFVAESIAREIKGENLLVIDAEKSPENFIGKLLDFKPGVVVFVDAVHFDAEPGTIMFTELQGDELVGVNTVSTHRISIRMLSNMLRKELRARIFLVGVQPGKTEMREGLTEVVFESKTLVENELMAVLEAVKC
jgi:hydrogenase 3 maturation protease